MLFVCLDTGRTTLNGVFEMKFLKDFLFYLSCTTTGGFVGMVLADPKEYSLSFILFNFMFCVVIALGVTLISHREDTDAQ